MKAKAKCARALIRYLKAKENERENSNELCKTKLYYATCRQRVCDQNKDYLCLHAARTLRARRTLIFEEQASQINGFVLKEEKKAYIARLGRDQLEHLASPCPTSPRQVRDDRKTSRVRTRVVQP